MATTYTIPNRPINDSMSYNKNVNNRKPHFTPRVLYSLEKTNREGKDGTNREQDNVSAALIQYAETEMLKHENMLENCLQVDHTLSGFHVPEDATADRASEKRAIMLAPKVFAKPLNAVEELKKRLHEAPVTAHSREAKAYYKSISRKLDAYFSKKGKVVEMPPPQLIQALNKNVDLAQKQTESHEGEDEWKRRRLKFKLNTRNVRSILVEQEKDWQNRRLQNHITAPSYLCNAVPHKSLVDFNKVRRCNLDVEKPPPIEDNFFNENDTRDDDNIDDSNKTSTNNYTKKLFLKNTTSIATKQNGINDTKDDLIKEVRARKYRGGGIQLSENDIYNKPKSKSSKAFNKYASLRNAVNQNRIMMKKKIIEEKKAISPKEKLLRKLLQTKEDYYKQVENGIRKNIKISMGGLVGKPPMPFGPQLVKVQTNSKSDDVGNGNSFTISYPSPFASGAAVFPTSSMSTTIKEDMKDTNSSRHNRRKRMPSYFEIDEAYLQKFFSKKGDLMEENM